MTEQIKNNIINQIKYFEKATTNENRFVVAKELVDRLFVTDYFSLDEMANFIKNELASIFNLTEQETETILKEYEEEHENEEENKRENEDKEKVINDKLKIAQLKKSLQDIPIYEQELLKCLNLVEVENIVDYIVNNIEIYNINHIKDFVMSDLSQYFKLTNEEKAELKEVLENECSNIEKKNIWNFFRS